MITAPSVLGSGALGTVRARPSTARFRRASGAAALLIAPWCFVGANLGYAWATRHGGDDLTGAHALALVANYTRLWRGILASGMVGCLLTVPALMAGMTLLRPHVPRLSLFAGSSMIAGYMCYLGVLAQNYVLVAMAERGGPVRDFAAVLDASQNDPSAVWVFALFAFGNLIGTLLFALALFRARAAIPVPGWVPIAVAAWPVLHITGLIVGSEWFEVTGGVLQALGLAALAMATLRTPDHHWNGGLTAG